MDVVDNIILIMKLERMPWISEENCRASLEYQLREKFFHMIVEDNQTIGFFGWRIHDMGDGLDIYINNFLILRKHRKNFNFLKYILKFFRTKYVKVNKFYWTNRNMKKVTMKERGLSYVS